MVPGDSFASWIAASKAGQRAALCRSSDLARKRDPLIRVITTAPLTVEQKAVVLAFVENDQNFSASEVAFELGDFLEVDVPPDAGKFTEHFGASVLALVAGYFSEQAPTPARAGNPTSQTVLVAGHVFALEASGGEVTLNRTEATRRELRALEEALHHVRIKADLQAAEIRRARKDGGK